MAKRTTSSKMSKPTKKRQHFNEDELDLIEQALRNEGVKASLIKRVLSALEHPGSSDKPNA